MKLLFQGYLRVVIIIKILNDNYNYKDVSCVTFPLYHKCEHCESEYEIEEMDELHEGTLGDYYVICPICKHKSYVDEIDGKTLTKDNIVFPINFFHSVNGVDLDSEEIRKYISGAIEFFRKNPEAFTYTTGSGNTGVIVENFSGDKEYHVWVTKDYYDTYIPYEAEDIVAQEENGWDWQNKGIINWKEIRGIDKD